MTRFRPNLTPCGRTRREFLWQVGGGFAGLALIDLLTRTGAFAAEAIGGLAAARGLRTFRRRRSMRLPVHERRAEPGRHVRSQAGADAKFHGKPYTGDAKVGSNGRAVGHLMQSPFEFTASTARADCRSAACFRTRHGTPTTCA